MQHRTTVTLLSGKFSETDVCAWWNKRTPADREAIARELALGQPAERWAGTWESLEARQRTLLFAALSDMSK